MSYDTEASLFTSFLPEYGQNFALLLKTFSSELSFLNEVHAILCV